MTNRPHIGNILGRYKTETQYPKLVLSYMGKSETFVLTFPEFQVSPLIPVKVWKYKYETPERRVLTLVEEWYFNVKIKVVWAGRETWAKFLEFLNKACKIAPSSRKFLDTGIFEPFKLYYWSPGLIRIPVDVEEISSAGVKYFDGKLAGYEGFEVLLRSKETYPSPLLSVDYFFYFDITADLQAFAVKDILPILPNM